jgi:hypothetical protein
MRRSLAWLVAVPLMLAGSQAAHVLAYRWAYPDAPVRLRALFATGHGYTSKLPLALGIAAAVAVVSLVLSAFDAARGRRARPLPAFAFALLPPLAFVVQELLERSLHDGTFAWQMALAPTLRLGLLLQVPFALAAYVTARFLLHAAERVGLAFAPKPKLAPRAVALVPAAVPAPSVRLLARRLSGRGPPLPVAA